MKKMLAAMLFIVISFTLSFGQSGGDGTVDDPYQIATYADLQWMDTTSAEWNMHFIQTADINAAATAVDGWAPIGLNPVFAGSYDGGGFTIDSLTITGGNYVAFIAQTGGTASVKNLGLTNVNFTCTGGDFVGALIGYMNGGTVENCYSTGNISSETSSIGGTGYGGLIGRIGDKTNYPIVTDSYSEVNISGMLPTEVGGFAGLMVLNGSISDCYSTGSVEGEDQIGAFIGLLEKGSVIKSYSTGNATANDKNAGGFVGYNYKGSISECYSTGDAAGGRVTGGFVGQNNGDVATISNCYSFGSVNPGDDHSGGFCGRNYKSATIENCYSTGTNNGYADRGFAGTSYGNGDEVIAGCFLDTTASGCTDVYATGKTTTEMKTAAIFTDAGWDLNNIWQVEGNYPNLRNNPNSDLEPPEDIQDPLPEGMELIANYNFNDGLNHWEFYSQDPGYAHYELDGTGVINGPNSVKITVDTTYNGYPSGRIALFQNVPIENGKEYYLTFKIRSSKVIDDKAIWWCMYDSLETQNYYSGMWGQVTLDKDTTIKYELTFKADFSNPTTDFSIDLAGIPSDSTILWLDDIHLIKLGVEDIQDPLPEGTELIANYNFNDGLNGWLFNNTDSLAGATYSLDENSVINGPNSVKVHMDTCAGGGPSSRVALFTEVPIEEGEEYYITFKIKATKAVSEWDLYWVFYDSIETGNYYNPVGGWGVTTWSMEKDSVYKFELNYTSDFSNPKTDFSIDFAYMKTGPIDFWLDDIHLIKIKNEEPPTESKSLTFNLSDPRDEYVIVSDTSNFGLDTTWTMEAWVNFANFDAPGGEDHIMRLGAQLFVDDNNKLKVQADGNYVEGTSELVAGKWYHIAYVRTPREVTVYLNGVKEIVAPGADAGAAADRFLLGSYGDPNINYNFAGIMDEVRLWKVARSAEEINETRFTELTGTEDSLVIYYDFNDGSGNTVVNRAGDNYNGTLGNMDEGNWCVKTPLDTVIIDEPTLPEGVDLISNNYFNDGLDKWDLYKNVQSYATLSLNSDGMLEGEKSAQVHINATGDEDWNIQFRQLEIKGVQEGHEYHVQFMAKANKDVSGISAVIQKNHGNFANLYAKELSLTADQKLVVIDTFMCNVTDSVIVWSFNLGTASINDVDVWFDAAHVIDLGVPTNVEEENALPVVFALKQNYPNPFNPTTTISFALPKASDVQLSVYNILGQKVAELVNRKMVAGNHTVQFKATNLSSGVYIYRIKAGKFVSIKKMMLLK